MAWVASRPIKSTHAADGAKLVLRSLGSKLIQAELVPPFLQLEPILRDEKVDVVFHGTDAAVTVNRHLFRSALELELHCTAMAGACVRHQSLHLSGNQRE